MRSFYQLQVTFFSHKTLLVKTFNSYFMPQPPTFVPAADSNLASMSKLLTAIVTDHLPHYCLQTTFFMKYLFGLVIWDVTCHLVHRY